MLLLKANTSRKSARPAPCASAFASFLLLSLCVTALADEPLADPLPAEEATSSSTDDSTGLDEDDDLDSLFDQSLESLSSAQVAAPELSAEVSTISRSETPIGKTPAAVFVITNEMIQRSGARTLPDVLRMVPGLQVSRMTNGTWSIGMRGNSTTSTDDLLVQVDGRSIYSKIFGGTIWGAQDFVLQDIDRIEIVRGPGGSVWGANAVRGVINIVTKCSSETQGLYVEAAAGKELRHTETIRYGGKTKYGHYRVWGRNLQLDGGLLSTGPDAGRWTTNLAGFRMDLTETVFDKLTVDVGVIDSSQVTRSRFSIPTAPFSEVANGRGEDFSWYTNVTGEYNYSDTESVLLRGSFYDTTRSGRIVQYQPMQQTEFDFQHNVKLNERHSLVWGMNYRRATIDIVPTFFLESLSSGFEVNSYGLFVQDTISLREDLALTVGAKLSTNDLSGFEHQPTGRLVFNPNDKTAIWTSVSRAVRTPTFRDVDSRIRSGAVSTTPLPLFPALLGNPNNASEDLLAVEAGIRQQPEKHFYWDFSAYHFTFRDMIGFNPPGAPVPSFPGTLELPITTSNMPGTVEVAGFELFGKYDVSETWRLSGNYAFAHNFDDGFSFPKNSVFLQTSHDFTDRLQLDLIWRYIDSFSRVDHYNTGDLRLSYDWNPNVRVSLVGQNLLNPSHFEEAGIPRAGTIASAAQRGVYGMVQMQF